MPGKCSCSCRDSRHLGEPGVLRRHEHCVVTPSCCGSGVRAPPAVCCTCYMWQPPCATCGSHLQHSVVPWGRLLSWQAGSPGEGELVINVQPLILQRDNSVVHPTCSAGVPSGVGTWVPQANKTPRQLSHLPPPSPRLCPCTPGLDRTVSSKVHVRLGLQNGPDLEIESLQM